MAQDDVSNNTTATANDAHLHNDNETIIHGLTYPPDLLSHLPSILPPPSDPSSRPLRPIYSLSTAQFADLHTRYLLSHAPDSVLFPFLHGLEGGSDALRLFFSSARPYSSSPSAPPNKGAKRGDVELPKFRGLVWVASEDPGEVGLGLEDVGLRWGDEFGGGGGFGYDSYDLDDDDDELEDEDVEDYESDEFEEGKGEAMDVDVEVGAVFGLGGHGHEDGNHMHPVAHRPALITTQPLVPIPTQSASQTQPIYTTGPSPSHVHDRRPSTASSFSDSSTSALSSSSSSNSSEGQASVESNTSFGASNPPSSPLSCSAPCLPSPTTTQTQTQTNTNGHAHSPSTQPHATIRSKQPSPYPPTPTYLTSTFFARDLLRTLNGKDGEGVEFVPPKVPEGISLRNFGVQVPIFTTISDIVVYSPTGNTLRAVALAEKFREAVWRKEVERSVRGGTDPEDLVKYNVFVLNAATHEMREGLESLLMRTEDEVCHVDHVDGDHHQHDHTSRVRKFHVKSDVGVIGNGLRVRRKRNRAPIGDIIARPHRPPPPDDFSPTTDSPSVFIPPTTGYGINVADSSGRGVVKKTTGAHTDGTDAHVVGEMDLDERCDGARLVNGTAHLSEHPHLVAEHPHHVAGPPHHVAAGTAKSTKANSKKKMLKANTIDFAQREKEEMRDLTRASEIFTMWDVGGGSREKTPTVTTPTANGTSTSGYSSMVLSGPGVTSPVSVESVGEKEEREKVSASNTSTYWNPALGQIYLGNSNDVPLAPEIPTTSHHTSRPPLHPSSSTSRPQSHHGPVDEDDVMNEPGQDPFDFTSNDPAQGYGYDICVECHDMAPFPSSAHLRAAEEHLCALEALWAEKCGRKRTRSASSPSYLDGKQEDEEPLPPRPPPNANAVIHLPFPSSPPSTAITVSATMPFVAFLERLLQPVLPPSPPQSPDGESVKATPSVPVPRSRSMSAASSPYAYPPSLPSPSSPTPPPGPRSRPIKILIYSADGYTESSVLALTLLMALRGLSLPEAYLELQVVKKRSFFVYSSDLGVLKRVEGRLERDRDGGAVRSGMPIVGGPRAYGRPGSVGESGNALGSLVSSSWHSRADSVGSSGQPVLPQLQQQPNGVMVKRPRACTSPALPPFVAGHEAWFNDPRFDGSFPSRVLPFLYLGNLNHASNVYMLHALGITHVVSVGECALVPPPNFSEHTHNKTCNAQFIPGKGPGGQGSLWVEEREGRMKVLDIQGVCDDGIDTLEPQLEPICDWIDKARAEGGQVLVHCRVGVSRSATVTIAYVMKYLGLPLVDAYLIVRSRRLSVLIQPNMRLLYNLLGWEVKLARQRAGNDEEKLKNEFSRSLNWPYLSREVHALNDKYLH
ncbi:hypothetical protein JAAARDRAFT_210382 [Jaapia argillacea MUCL 33604]|uniref:Uncharacterized protein n=1 Tax=Jaapia argillacea MUCL 33604 TaxID=933084 RepID=A0A067PD28_9AGAM|nr:hypothetical protein JAAARDRAFT_210382 [Jaapia argillacea MUCL 33604]